METVATGIHTALNAHATSGGTLSAVENRVYLNATDVRRDARHGYPCLVVDYDVPTQLDACRGSRILIYEGLVQVLIEVHRDRGDDNSADTAHDTGEDIRERVERVLLDNRSKANGDWDHLSIIASGQLEPRAGTAQVAGVELFRHVVVAQVRFHRRREAA